MSIFNEQEPNETVAQADAGAAEEITQRMKSGANWFYWIAALSLINSIILFAGGQWNFIVGLAVTQFIDGIMQTVSGQASSFNVFGIAGLVLDIVVAGVFALFGYFSGRGAIFMFIAGMFLYVLDALLYLFAGDYLAAGFHAFALFFIGKGLMAAFEYKALNKPGQMMQS